MTPDAFDVVIVGGGASGTLLAFQLLRHRAGPQRLLVVDRAGDFARGVAYRTTDPVHLLNVPAGRMSAFPDDEEHFLTWLRAQSPGAGPETYAQRRLYGDYLVELLATAERTAPAGAVLERRQAEVREASLEPGGVRLGLDRGPAVLARQAVLAIGNFPPAPLPVSAAAAARVWRSPWPKAETWPEADDAVLLVGAGLSAVDLLLSLAERGHRGPLHVLSRHGLLPNAHRTPTSPPLVFPDPPRGALRPLLRLVRRAAAQTPDWRAAVDGLRPHIQMLWRALGDAERRRFSRHLRTYWEVHRHRIAPEVAERVRGMIDSGQVRLVAGRPRMLDLVGSRLEARIRLRGATGEERLYVDLAVNCTGPAGHSLHADALVGVLLRDGLARPGPLGLGLATNLEGAVLDASGAATGRLWALGPVRRGELWESVAVPDIRVQAADLAARLAAR